MEKLMVKYCNGKCQFVFHNASAAMVDQVLEQIQDDLRQVCGNYKWALDGDKYKGYKIIASCGKDRWCESQGKTPSQCLKGFYSAKMILANKYGIN